MVDLNAAYTKRNRERKRADLFCSPPGAPRRRSARTRRGGSRLSSPRMPPPVPPPPSSPPQPPSPPDPPYIPLDELYDRLIAGSNNITSRKPSTYYVVADAYGNASGGDIWAVGPSRVRCCYDILDYEPSHASPISWPSVAILGISIIMSLAGCRAWFVSRRRSRRAQREQPLEELRHALTDSAVQVDSTVQAKDVEAGGSSAQHADIAMTMVEASEAGAVAGEEPRTDGEGSVGASASLPAWDVMFVEE